MILPEMIWVGLAPGRSLGLPRTTRTRDSEGIAIWEGFGAHRFAWTPKRCRNGRVRWLKTLERHDDGSYTLGRLH